MSDHVLYPPGICRCEFCGKVKALTAACEEARRLIYDHDDLTHWVDACSRDTCCDERDDDNGCDVHGMDTCPRCECGAGRHNGDIRLAIATLDRALTK